MTSATGGAWSDAARCCWRAPTLSCGPRPLALRPDPRDLAVATPTRVAAPAAGSVLRRPVGLAAAATIAVTQPVMTTFMGTSFPVLAVVALGALAFPLALLARLREASPGRWPAAGAPSAAGRPSRTPPV